MPTRTTHFTLASLLLLTSPTLAAAQQRPLTQWERQARELLRELVEHNTTEGSGDMTAASEAMARHMRAAGFPAEDVVVVASGPARKDLGFMPLRGFGSPILTHGQECLLNVWSPNGPVEIV